MLRERGISSLDVTRASKVRKVVGNMPEKGQGRKEGTGGGREEREERREERRERRREVS